MPSSQFRRRGLGALVAGVLVATGGLAYAAIPDAGGVIHSRYAKSSGAWRVIDSDAGQTCKSNEAPLDLYSKGGADAAFLAKADRAADSDKLDGKDSADFLSANATAVDSDRLGGLVAEWYVFGSGVRFMDAGNLADGAASSFQCCDEPELTPSMTVELRCDTAGGTTLTASSAGSFRWWWGGAFGHATPAASGFEARFTVANGVSRNTLRTTTGGLALTYDLDTSIDTSCDFGWTWTQAYHITPN